MRPRRVRRGNDGMITPSGMMGGRFNEAPACPPGKSASRASGSVISFMLQ